MSWAKVDDGWWCHPKVMGLSPAARGLWVSGLSWSCAQRRDVVPSTFPPMIGCGTDEAAELVGVGLWDVVDGGWRIHDWSDYQELTTAEKRAEAGRAGGKASGRSRRQQSKAEANAKQTDVASPLLTKQDDEAGTRPVPTRPDPSSSPAPPHDEEEEAVDAQVAALAAALPSDVDIDELGAARLRRALADITVRGWPPDQAAQALVARSFDTADSVTAALISRAEILARTDPTPTRQAPARASPDCTACRGSGWTIDDNTAEAQPCPCRLTSTDRAMATG